MQLDFNNLSLENFVSWPKPIKIGIAVILAIVLIIFGYILDISPQLSNLANVQAQETKLKEQLSSLYQKISLLNQDIAMIQEAQMKFGAQLKQIPDTSNIAVLLRDIAKFGSANDLDFASIKPFPELPQGFVVKVPIQIVVGGTYHQLANFISNLANLNYLLTFGNFTITLNKPVGKSAGSDNDNLGDERLQMMIMVESYYKRSQIEINNERAEKEKQLKTKGKR